MRDLMHLEDRIQLMSQLGDYLRSDDEYLSAVIKRTAFHNPWFTEENQRAALQAIGEQLLSEDKLRQWVGHYAINDSVVAKQVGLVMAGNLPLVGFHDFLCVFMAGHQAQVKLSEKDPYLFPAIVRFLGQQNENSTTYIDLVNQLKGFQAVIATGSNNSARYFEAYFGQYPHIIRKNRNGVAVLSGHESSEELTALGQDVFAYFGLGCRNVSKLYVPQDYDFTPLLEALHEYREIILHTKYKNNFDYNYALMVLNKVPYLGNGCVLLREETSLQSPIASLFYETYESTDALEAELARRKEEIQLVVAGEGHLPNTSTFAFGKAQSPGLRDYADGVDTMQFLLGL